MYIDAERRFKDLESETKKLHDESKKYFEAINGMLNHQMGFSTAVEEIYKPISGRVSEQDSALPEGNPEGIRACEQYREVVADMLATLKPELEMIETKIIAPADELLRVINMIRKMATKRDRKQLDLDRHKGSLTKLEGKKELSIKDEKAKYTLENNVEIATQEYDYFNNMLKEELPQLFHLEAEFIKPLFQSFYYMQLNIFYTLYTRMEEMNVAYFDMKSDIMTSFEAKRGTIQEQTEAIAITHFRLGQAKSKLEMTRHKFGKEEELKADAATAGAAVEASAPPPYHADPSLLEQQVYGQEKQQLYQQPTSGYGGQQPASVPSPVPPPVPPHAGATTTEYCTALYEYVPQASGDLGIKPGDVIEIVQRTSDVNGWWTGRLTNGQVGVFPGNYVQLR